VEVDGRWVVGGLWAWWREVEMGGGWSVGVVEGGGRGGRW
jgi:hypothetical protein